MPQLQKHVAANKLHRGHSERRMSSSTGDLLGLLKKEFKENKYSQFVPVLCVNDLTERINSPTEDMVVCGFLYRLTPTGIWFRFWVELRFNYLMGFYHQTDELPIDVVNLEGYAVKKAAECDHLESLYPIKVYKKGEKDLFFYTESEESRMEWMTNLKKTAQQEILSFNVMGLNLECDHLNTKTILNRTNENIRRNSIVVRNINNKEINDMTILEEDSDRFENLDLKSAEEVITKYERAEAVTQHEALRLATHYWQRRISTQIKLSTLEDLIGENSSTKLTKKTLQSKLDQLRNHLSNIEEERVKSEKAVECVFHQLESKKTEALESLHAPMETLQEKETKPKVKVIIDTQKTIIEDQFRGLRKSKSTSADFRHSFPSSGSLKNGNKMSASVADFADVFDTNINKQSKRPSPLKLLSNAIRHHHKKDKKDLSPQSPSSTESSPCFTMKFDSSNEEIANGKEEDVVNDGSVLGKKAKSQSPCLPRSRFSKRVRRFFSFNAKSSKSWSPS